jgi:two-component system, OmpR family, sensor kinase
VTAAGLAAPERRLIRRAGMMLAVRIAVILTLAIGFLGVCAYRLVASEQQSQVSQTLRYEVGYGKPADSTPCLWLFVMDRGHLERPAQSPAGFPLMTAIRSAPSNGQSASQSLSANGTVYDVMAQRSGDEIREAVFDTRYQRADLLHLLRALLLTELVGLLASMVAGFLLAKRSISPLGDALARQRRFVADASHELRTPLTRLHTRAQLILRLRSADLPEQLTAELEHIVEGTRELNEVVDDLLTSASLGPNSPRLERIDLAALAASVIEAEQPRLAQRSLTLALARGRDGGPSTVIGAASPLRRMISALVDNAIGHTSCTGRIELMLSSADRGQSVQLDVTDDGTGFDPADSTRIFERFARGGEHDSRRFGLGLALVREVVESHGGTIRAEGRPGEGAHFTVRLPAAPPLGAEARGTAKRVWMFRPTHSG